MTEELEYVKNDKGACVTKILAPGAVVVIPDCLGGEPVTQLADHAFAGTGVREVFLPKPLERIGRYAFYNCEELTALHFYGGVREVGGGLFNGCRKISELFVHMDRGEQSALKDFVNELNGRLTVHYFLEEKEAARLVFPLYYDEAVENTPARIISSSIHGCGHRYRYCFENRKLLFDRYDKTFFYEINEEGVLPAAELALGRLLYPYGLSAGAEEAYLEFLVEHRLVVLERYLAETEIFKWLLKKLEARGDGLSEKEVDRLSEAAGVRRTAEAASLLLDLRHRKFRAVRKAFEL